MKILVDSDALFALFVAHDPHHTKAKQLFHTVSTRGAQFYTLNIVIQETATVLSHKIGQAVSLTFLKELSNLELDIIPLDDTLEQKSWEIFKKQTKKGTSFVDCANIATVEHFKMNGILSFDTFYPQELRVQS